jgi:hypothetical protein
MFRRPDALEYTMWLVDPTGCKTHKFGVPHLGALFMQTATGPPEHEKYYVDVSGPVRTRMYYVNRRS